MIGPRVDPGLGPSPFPLIVRGCGGKGLGKRLSLARARAGAGVRMQSPQHYDAESWFRTLRMQ